MRVAVVQTNSISDKQANIVSIQNFIYEAAKNKAVFISFPEMVLLRNVKPTQMVENGESIEGSFICLMQKLAKELSVFIHIGSFPETCECNTEKVFNTSVLINAKGLVEAIYRKIHLFDARTDQFSIQESNAFKAGDSPTLATLTQGFKAGLSICYDLRFPELYHYYRNNGANILLTPASFTHATGAAHWHILNRCRAIENQCYVLAANQIGTGSNGVLTYGHSLIVDPWGTIIAEAPENEECILYADLSTDFLQLIRNKMPLSTHHRCDIWKMFK